MPQEAGEIDDYREVASGSPGLKDSLSKWASSQPAGDKIKDYPVPGRGARVKDEKYKKDKCLGDANVNKIIKYPKTDPMARDDKKIKI